jgi:hypothetical protein
MLGRATIDGHYLDRKTRKYQTFYVGKRNGMKHIVIYNKTKELTTQSNKTYISDFWQLNAIDTSKNITRCEISLDSRYLKTIDAFDFDKLQDIDYLKNIYYTATRSFFEFRENDIFETNLSRLKNINVIPFELISDNTQKLDRHELPIHDKNFQTKISIKNDVMLLMRKEIKPIQRESFYECLKIKIQSTGLINWFEKKLPEWIKMYRCYQNTGHYYVSIEGELSEEIQDEAMNEEECVKKLDALFKDIEKPRIYQHVIAEELISLPFNN